MQNSRVFQAVAEALKGTTSALEVLQALSADGTAPRMGRTDAGSEQAIPKIAQLTRSLISLKIELLSYGDTEESIRSALDGLRVEYGRLGIDWFLSYYKEAAFIAMTPKRRVAVAEWLVDMAKQADVPPALYWTQILSQQGLLEND